MQFIFKKKLEVPADLCAAGQLHGVCPVPTPNTFLPKEIRQGWEEECMVTLPSLCSWRAAIEVEKEDSFQKCSVLALVCSHPHAKESHFKNSTLHYMPTVSQEAFVRARN